MNNIIVGMGEALWDVLPEGKKIGAATLIVKIIGEESNKHDTGGVFAL